MKKIALYPGSFDPFTKGHQSVIERAAPLFDELVVLVAVNSRKLARFSPDERVTMIKIACKDLPSVRVEHYAGLTMDFAEKNYAKYIVRGLRGVEDLSHEHTLAIAHREAKGLETLFFPSLNDHISSSLVREILSYGGDVSLWVPKEILDLVR